MNGPSPHTRTLIQGRNPASLDTPSGTTTPTQNQRQGIMKTTPETDATPTGVPLDERETTITGTDADDTLHIWSCRRRHITAMRKHPAFTETDTGTIPGTTTEYACFTIADTDWNPATGGRRKRNMTDEQRAELSARARKNFGKQNT